MANTITYGETFDLIFTALKSDGTVNTTAQLNWGNFSITDQFKTVFNMENMVWNSGKGTITVRCPYRKGSYPDGSKGKLTLTLKTTLSDVVFSPNTIDVYMPNPYKGMFMLDGAYFAYSSPECAISNSSNMYDYSGNERHGAIFDSTNKEITVIEKLETSQQYIFGMSYTSEEMLSFQTTAFSLGRYSGFMAPNRKIGYYNKNIIIQDANSIPIKSIQVVEFCVDPKRKDYSFFSYFAKTSIGNFSLEILSLDPILYSTYNATIGGSFPYDRIHAVIKVNNQLYPIQMAMPSNGMGDDYVISYLNLITLRLEPQSNNTIKWQVFIGDARSDRDAIASDVATLDQSIILPTTGIAIIAHEGIATGISTTRPRITEFVGYSDLKPFDFLSANAAGL